MDELAQAERISVACGSDDHYGMPLAVTLYSLVSNLSPGAHIVIYVLSLGMTAATKDRIRRVTSRPDVHLAVEFIEVDGSRLAELQGVGHLSVAAYLRVFLPLLLPADCNKVLYLDSDLIIRKDVQPLWDKDVSGYTLLAARDPWIVDVAYKGGLYNWEELSIAPDAVYFNSGVLVINLKRWRDEGLFEKLTCYAAEHKEKLLFADQDALNALCYDSWGELEMTWNLVPLPLPDVANWEETSLKEYVLKHYDELWNDPAIRHYATRWKPWSAGFEPPFRHEWFTALKNSGWFTPAEYNKWRLQWTVKHYRAAFRRKVLGKSG